MPAGDRPLAGVKVLDLTRVIAGPVCGRTLAAHGADVLLVPAHLPQMQALIIDNGRGKLSTSIDLRDAPGRETLAGLLRDADIFVQGYRPGAIAAHGFGPQEAARLRPGIVYVSLCAYGDEGRGRPAAASTCWCRTPTASTSRRPKRPVRASRSRCPGQALDHATGHLMAFAAMSALARRVREGGSWHVRISLAQTGQGLRGLGRIDGPLSLSRSRLRGCARPPG